jgi:hypothetical protein
MEFRYHVSEPGGASTAGDVGCYFRFGLAHSADGGRSFQWAGYVLEPALSFECAATRPPTPPPRPPRPPVPVSGHRAPPRWPACRGGARHRTGRHTVHGSRYARPAWFPNMGPSRRGRQGHSAAPSPDPIGILRINENGAKLNDPTALVLLQAWPTTSRRTATSRSTTATRRRPRRAAAGSPTSRPTRRAPATRTRVWRWRARGSPRSWPRPK